jgi:hypothetical protein
MIRIFILWYSTSKDYKGTIETGLITFVLCCKKAINTTPSYIKVYHFDYIVFLIDNTVFYMLCTMIKYDMILNKILVTIRIMICLISLDDYIKDICLVQCKIGIYFNEWAPKGIFHEWCSHEWNMNFWCSQGEIYFDLTLN